MAHLDSHMPADFLALACPLAALRIVVDPAPPPAPTGEMLARWAEATGANPRLFNGPILRFQAFDPASRTIEASRDTYQRYAMQPAERRPGPPPAPPRRFAVASDLIYHLAVTGVITSEDARGREHVLLGRRGPATFVYPGLWELAPGGGLESADVWAQLLQEMEEELSLPGLRSCEGEFLRPVGPTDLLGLSIDPNTPSVDVVVRVRLTRGLGSIATEGGASGSGEHAWEYGSVRWVAIDALADLARGEAGGIIPPSLAIWRGLGWI